MQLWDKNKTNWAVIMSSFDQLAWWTGRLGNTRLSFTLGSPTSSSVLALLSEPPSLSRRSTQCIIIITLGRSSSNYAMGNHGSLLMEDRAVCKPRRSLQRETLHPIVPSCGCFLDQSDFRSTVNHGSSDAIGTDVTSMGPTLGIHCT